MLLIYSLIFDIVTRDACAHGNLDTVKKYIHQDPGRLGDSYLNCIMYLLKVIPIERFYQLKNISLSHLVQSKYEEFAKKSTHDGESCLHLTAISNSVEIAELVIENGANVNLRVTHPLVSWFVSNNTRTQLHSLIFCHFGTYSLTFKY
jgi:Ankyrin repeat.